MNVYILAIIFITIIIITAKRFEIELKSTKSIQKSANIEDISILLKPESQMKQNKRMLKSIDKELINFKDLQYYGVLYIGSTRQKLTFIFDSGSTVTWVPMDLKSQSISENTNKTKFYLDQSKTAKILDITPQFLSYGTGEVMGIRISDDVFMEESGDQSVKSFNMLGVLKSADIDGDMADGILGLGRLKPSAEKKHFVSLLKQNDLIDFEMFSFDFKSEDKNSKVIFGDVDTDIVNNLHDVIWAPCAGDDEEYWTIPVGGIRYGNTLTMKQTKYAVIDTGSSTIALSESNFLDLMQDILDTGLECGFFVEEKFVACVCPHGMKDFKQIQLNINGYEFSLDPEDYIVNEEDICVILAYNLGNRVAIAESTIILGANFLRKFYTVFDIGNDRVGIYGKPINLHASTVKIFTFACLMFSFIIASILLLCYLFRREKDYSFDKDDIFEKDKAKMHSQIAIKI